MPSLGPASSRSIHAVILMILSCWSMSFAQENRDRSLRVIVVPNANEASHLRTRIANGESFHALALAHSVDESAARGGDLGVVSPADLHPEYQDALSSAVDGLSPVVPVDGSFVILQWVPEIETEWRELRELGLNASVRGDFAEAGDLFARALRIAETFGMEDARLAESLNDAAEAGRRNGREDDAIGFYERAIAIWEASPRARSPSVATSLTNLAGLRTRRGQFMEAEQLYRRAIAIWTDAFGAEDLNVAGARSSLARVLDAQGQHNEAADLYRQVLVTRESAFGPRDGQVAATLADLANTLAAAGRSAEAVRVTERLLGVEWASEGGAGDPTAIVRSVESLVDVVSRSFLGERPGRVLETLLEHVRHPEVAEPLLLSSARLLAAVGLSEEADEVLTATIERFPDSRAARYERADLRGDNGRIGDAINDLTSALDLGGSGPGSGVLFRILGNQHVELGEVGDALSFYARALDTDSLDPSTHTALGMLLVRMSDPDRARDAFGQAVRLDPINTGALIGLAEVELDASRFPEAIRVASEVLSIDPENEQARYVRARALIQDGRVDEGSSELEAYRKAADDARDREAALFERTVIERDVVRSLRDEDIDLALDILESAVESFGDEARLRLIRAILLGASGRSMEAIDALHAIIEGGLGDDSVIHRNLELLYASTGDTELEARHRTRFLARIRSELEARRPFYLPTER